MKRVVILGSTGSIGENAVRVAETIPDRVKITGLATRTKIGRILEQAKQFNVKNVAVSDPAAADECRKLAGPDINVLCGDEGVAELAALEDADTVLCSVVGMAGLKPVLSALEAGSDIALATKEVLVAAGSIVMETARKKGLRILPVDSEHSAIFQCLGEAYKKTDVKRLLLTASGGPFGNKPDVNLDEVTIEQALAHPSWSMGRKVTIDSATLMNKGLETIEAHWLFDIPMADIDVVTHPQSIIHSIVEFKDASMLAQMSLPDMRFAIQYALTYPDRVDGELPQLDLPSIRTLSFDEPDRARFPALDLARGAAERGGTLPAVMNAANEIAVETFLTGSIKFSAIWQSVERVMAKHTVIDDPSLDDIIEADAWARQEADALTK